MAAAGWAQRSRRVVILCCLCLASAGALAGSVLERVIGQGQLRVCVWPAYQGITWRDPQTQAMSGLDADMARAFAADMGVRVQWVDSSFAGLIDRKSVV